MNDEQKTKLAERLAALNLEYTAVFVPQSASRNSTEKQPSLNWRVTVVRAKTNGTHHSPRVIATDYMQGIGHVPGYIHAHRGTADAMATTREQHAAAETGQYPDIARKSNALGGRYMLKLPPPGLADVLYSLLLDSDAAECSFEEWCDNYGYDADSRKAERTYNACRDMGQKLQRMFTRSELEELRELFQDY